MAEIWGPAPPTRAVYPPWWGYWYSVHLKVYFKRCRATIDQLPPAVTACCSHHTVGGKNSATPAVFALFAEFRPTSNFGRNFRLLWIFGFFGFFVNFRCFLMILLLNFDVHHSAGHLGWGRKGIALFFQRVAILFPPTVCRDASKPPASDC